MKPEQAWKMDLNTKIIRASGARGKEVRADGKGGTLKRGYYYHKPGYALGVVLVGPYRTERQAVEALAREPHAYGSWLVSAD